MNDLRTLRQRKGMTLEDLSELSGITLNNICFLERGKHFPRVKTQEAIENVLGPVNWIRTHQLGRLRSTNKYIKIEQSEAIDFVRNM